MNLKRLESLSRTLSELSVAAQPMATKGELLARLRRSEDGFPGLSREMNCEDWGELEDYYDLSTSTTRLLINHETYITSSVCAFLVTAKARVDLLVSLNTHRKDWNCTALFIEWLEDAGLYEETP